jgi:hypothetical protein
MRRALVFAMAVLAPVAACGLDVLGRGTFAGDAGLDATTMPDAAADVAREATGREGGGDAPLDAASDAPWWLDACPIPWGCQTDPGRILCPPSDPCARDGGNFCCGSSCVGPGTICLGPTSECEEQPDCPGAQVCCGTSSRYPPRLSCETDCRFDDFRACKMGSGECACALYCVDAGKPVLACGPPTRCP